MEMINKTVRDRLTAAGMDSAQAEAVASCLPAGSQVATQQDLVATQQVLRDIKVMVTDLKHQVRNFKWQIVGGVIALVVLPDNWLGVVLQQILAWQG